MSTTVDNRVVEMRFDNKQFEQNVSQTISSIDKLKEKLKLQDSSKGLENLNTAASRVNMSGLSNAVETVRTKFSALEVMGVTALANITNSAVNAGKRIASALTIEPIKTGLSEYETQINAVQTILANTESKGSTLKDVNKALDELNTYADKTIYNFTEMTKNIGTFTAAGVDLDTSVNSIQGIANLAAVSGSTSQQASTAMYQLSQAMASGTVKLMDWNSVVNAGMGGQVFQDSLKETARVHGVNIDKMIEKNGSFRETLKDGWLTTEILTETLEKFTMSTEGLTEAEIAANREKLKSKGYTDEQIDGIFKLGNTATNAATKVKTFTQLWDTLKETAQSGWTQTWEILLGDFEEAKDTFSKLYETFAPMIEASAKARNELLQGWKDEGGRKDLIDSFYNLVEAISSVIKPIKEAFRDIFPPMTVKQLVGFTEGLKKFTENLKLGSDASEKLKRTFKGLFAFVDILRQIFVAVVKSISPLFGGLGDLGGGFLDFTANIGDSIVKFNEFLKTSDALPTAIEKVRGALEKVIGFFKNIWSGVKNVAQNISSAFGDIAGNAEVRLQPLVAIGNFIKSIFSGLGKVIGKILPFVATAAKGIGNVLSDLMGRISDSIQNADYGKMFDLVNGGIMSAIGIFIAKFIKSGGDLLDNAGGFLENINNILGGVGDALNSFSESLKADALKKIATAIAILAAALFVLSLIDSEKLTLSLVAISTLFGELMASMSIFTKIIDGKKLKGIGKLAGAMIGLSAALLVLSVALKIMSTMTWEEMAVGLTGMVVGLGALVGAVNLLPEKNLNKAAKALKKLSTAVLIFSLAIKIMGTMSWNEIAVGLTGMVVGLAALVGAVNLLPKDAAIRTLGMLGLATAMVVLASALKIMATMSWGDIARSLVTLGGALIILVGALTLMKKAIPGALAMMIVAPALVVLAGALKIMASMSWEEIAKGLVALAGSLLILAGAMALMKKAIPGALAMMILAPAIVVLAGALKMMGGMSWEEIGKGLLLLAGAFVIIGVAGAVLGPMVPAILGLSGALLLLGVACAAVGAGILMLGVGLLAISAAGAGVAVALTAIVSSIISLIPYLIEQIGVGIIKLCEVIAGGAAAICEAVTVIILAVVDALVASVPAIVEGVFVLIESLLKSLVDHTPTIVGALFDFLIGILNAIADKLPDLIQAGVNVLMAFFQGVIDALKSVDPGVLVNGIIAVGMLTALVAAMALIAVLTPAAIVGVLGLGVVVTELAAVLAALGALAQIPGLDWLISEGGNLMQTIGTAIGQFIGGIAGGIAQGFTSSLPEVGTNLSDFMTNIQPFIDGAKAIDPSALEGVKTLTGVIAALTATNLLDSLTSWITGGSSLADFGAEIAAFGPSMKAYSDAVTGIDATAVEASANAARSLSELAKGLPNSGGLAGWFAGENDIGTFGAQLVPFGIGMKSYSDAIAGFNPEAVIASANAAKSLADMASYIPNQGGVAAWFAGDNSIAKFGNELTMLGMGLKMYSMSIAGFNPEAVIASANAAKALVDMTACIPNEGGMVAWFAGENSVVSFATQLETLGNGLSAYSNSIAGFNAEAVLASANAAQALVNMTACIPNEGGMAAWFSGENSISKFGTDLVALGKGLSGFSTAVEGVVPENITSAANAAKAIADMASTIPNEGGVVAWFTGDNSIANFASSLPKLGKGISGFSTAVEGVVPENITAAANAAKSLAEMASVIPKEGGMAAWFAGENSVASFGDKLPKLGKGLKGFSDSVKGISPQNVESASIAAKNLAEMADTTPKNTDKLTTFGTNLVTFGGKLKSYFDKVKDISTEALTSSTNAIKKIQEASSGLDPSSFKNASSAIDEMVKSIGKMSKVKASAADGFSSAIKKIGETNVKSLIDAFEGASSRIKKAGQDLIKQFTAGVESQNSNMKKAGQTTIDKFLEGIKARENKVKNTCGNLVSACSTAIRNKYSKFKSAGSYLVDGFASGINSRTWYAAAKAKAMADAAEKAAKKALDINSPSKVFRAIGYSVPEGFAQGIDRMTGLVKTSAIDMAKTAIGNVKSSIVSIADAINTDIDSQPTIRPVLDLSDVRSGASAIGGLFSANPSVGVLANVGAISSMMNQNGQNGGNGDVVSAIDKLRKDLGNVGNTTNYINGVTYDDGSNITGAVEQIVRAAKIGRRV